MTPMPSQDYFEDLIPNELKVLPGEFDINPSSATLYLALHPLFTSADSDIFSNLSLDGHSSELLRIIADSASTIIDGFVQMNKDHKILSIWRGVERILEAGAVWGIYLITLQRTKSVSGKDHRILTSSAMGPLLKCSTLLASFAERWKDGLIYAQIWETFLSLLLGALE